ncbi:hypothetical protein WR25_10540 isoform C [Diploscapter pachys]|uniref:Methylcrotonoyl-CoA carboxylase subunit alpha, mitochondrial n=1 Tax=Diploscapter pachys TaxID=2018661 RepID=A0A2A2LUU3_9BILA|nr:hypothetical protein WR25_10540 isoform A [Diploscapter pachys]PAV89960.1 hypothetical protein WR25_10540 isoform B [Diploscapter pachys]PAV89961.1 hypothetical protein WR25_10540 isoform C [Diploscapter pachys]
MNKWLLWSNQLSRSERMIRFVSQKCSSSTFHNENPIVRKISRVLIANRGEISIRVMNTARKMGIECVAVYSDADKGALFVRKADKAFHIGPPTAAQSYLNMDKIIDTALKSGAEAIHPGYGFLSENANFAEKCAEAGIVFIGPPVQAIRDMGTKSLAKSIMDKAGVPIVQGYHGDNQTDAHLKSEAARIGYPVMLKAVYGGGGKGMRIAWKESEFDEQLASARNEAKKSFGNDDMLVEKFVERPRHVEVQVFGDHHNNYVHLWERDCSVQRRHQKIIEEAPAPLIDMDTRLRLGEAAKRAAAAVHYVGAGTVEFIMDPRGEFYFMEMNTRLQVEHPVSEAITGTDLVEWQLRVAQGEKLPLTQEQIPLNGHAFECRVYAENTEKGTFMPTAGKLNAVRFPKDARVETAVVSGDEVSVHYDPMIAKIIVWGQDRRSAARLLDKALADTFISGLPTNISFGNVYTDFIPDFQEELFAEKKPSAEEMIEGAVALYLLSRPKNINGPFQAFPMFRINYAPKKEFKLGSQTVVLAFGSDGKITSEIDGQKYEIEIHTVHTHGDELSFGITVNGKRWNVDALDVQDKAVVHGISQNEYVTAKTYSDAGLSGSGEDADHAVAPMPGIIEKILVQKGQQVTKGQPVAVMTAMKMEYIIRAPRDASIADIHVKPGKNVTKNTQIVTFEEEKAQANA